MAASARSAVGAGPLALAAGGPAESVSGGAHHSVGVKSGAELVPRRAATQAAHTFLSSWG